MKTIAELRTWCAENPDKLVCTVNSLTLYNVLSYWRYAITRVIYTNTGRLPNAIDIMPRGRDILAQLNQLNADAAVESVAADYRLYL